MARLSWKGMKDEALLELRNRSDASSRIESWLRRAYMEVAYGYRFYELEATTTFILSVAASEIALTNTGATNAKILLSLRDQTNGRKLTPASFRFVDRRSDSDGTPTHYCRFGNSLLFDAKPASSGITYRLRYRKQISEPDFTSTSQFPETPDEWDEVIMLLGVARGFNALLEQGMADQIESRAMRLIAKLPLDKVVDDEDQNFGLTPRM